ncbi:hypothetical protein [Ekhidna sp.]
MRKLISSTGCEPKPLAGIEELANFSPEDVAGIVISTALSSTVKEKYWEVIKKAMQIFPDKPIFLASYSSVRSTKITAGTHIQQYEIPFELVSLDEVKLESFERKSNILILTQKEISDDSKFESILKVVKGILT